VQKRDKSSEQARVPWAHLRVPPFPAAALRVLELVHDEGSSMLSLSELISADPAFSSEVLTIANSALVAHRLAVTTISQAVALLGTRSLNGVCLTVGVRAYLGKALNHRSLWAIWRHSLACALVAEQLALAGSMDKDEAYTGGILHDIGRFALAVLRPKEYAALLESHRGPAASILEPERELFGFDHCEAGRHLVTDWKLPPAFESFASAPEPARRPGDEWHMADLIHMSCRMADTAGYTAFAGCETSSYAELLEELPARERGMFPNSIDVLALEVSERIRSIESL
jgi:HD-like signal output (HDOD) protein